MTSRDRTVKLTLAMNVLPFTKGMRDAAAAAKENAAAVEKWSRDNESAIDKQRAALEAYNAAQDQVRSGLITGLTAIGAAAVGAAGVVVARFAEFDKAMSAVQASTRAAGSELQALRGAAIQAGADTAFSAAEAAGAIDELAKAGVSTTAILSGGLSGALSLAAAGQVDVAQAAELSASALTQFKLEGSDVGHVADLLAAGAGKAQGSVSDMGEALNQSGLIANQTGLSIEETTGSLAAFANAGLLGSDAGTSFKTMLQVLSAPTDVAREQMEALGISAYDAGGNFVGMAEFAGQLRDALRDKTDEERSSALATIFGSDAVRAASVIYEQGAVGIQSWIDKVNDSGYAAETAAIKMDNLSGDVDKLMGSLDSVFIQSGSGANDFLRGVVQSAEAVVDAIGEIPGPLLNTTALIAGAGGLALLGVAGLGKLTVAFVEARAAATALGISTKATAISAGALGGALAVGTIAFTAWAQAAADAQARTDGYMATLDALGDRTDSTVRRINEALAANQNDFLDNLFGDDPESLIDRAERVGLSIQDLQGYILGEADAIERVTAATEEYVIAQGDAADGVLTRGEVTARTGRLLTDALDSEARALTDAEKAAAQKRLADSAAGIATQDLTSATEDATRATQTQTEAIRENWQEQVEAANGLLGLRDANRGFRQAIRDASDAIKDNGKNLDTNTTKGRANEAALDNVAAAGWRMVESAREQGATQSELRSKMVAARNAFVETAVKMGLSRQRAKELADELRLIPSDISVQVTADTTQARAAIQALRAMASVRATIDDGRNRAGFAVGGPVTGGVPNRDSVPAMLMPGEHVLTKRDVIALGGQAGVYALRASLHGGVLGMANGGAIGDASSDVARWSRELSSARMALRRARRAGSERAADSAESRIERAERQLEAAESRRDRLREEAASLRTSLRRGDLRDEVTGGLSGAISATDRLRDLADSGDLGRGRAGRLRGVAGAAERELTGLYKAADRAERRLAAARDRLEELRQIQSGVQSSIVGGFGLNADLSTTNEFGERVGGARSASALAAAAGQYAGRARRFGSLLERLRKASGSAAIVQEVAGFGVEEGIPLAQSLLADLPSLKSLAASLDDIERAGGRAGGVVARAVGGQWISSVEAAERAAAENAKAIDRSIARWAQKIGEATARALGVKPRAAGGPMYPGSAYITGEFGRELVIPQSPQYVMSAEATRRLAAANVNRPVSVTASVGDVVARLHPADVQAIVSGVRQGMGVSIAANEASQDRQALYVGGL